MVATPLKKMPPQPLTALDWEGVGFSLFSTGQVPSWNTAPQVRKRWDLRDLTAQELGVSGWSLRVPEFLMGGFAHMHTHI